MTTLASEAELIDHVNAMSAKGHQGLDPHPEWGWQKDADGNYFKPPAE